MRCSSVIRTAALALLASVAVPNALSAIPKTELVRNSSGWELLRDGQPYIIKGVGGSGPKQLLKEMGGNSFRTWNADDIGAQLDEAQQLGLTVTVGIWLEHERHGFSYNEANMVAKQYEKVREAVTKYKDHPAVLMWAIGNVF